MKIAFVWFWDRATEIKDNWRDGLRSALELIGKKHDVTWFLDKTTPDPKDNFDFLLFWDDSNSEFFKIIDNFKGKKGICLTTDPQNIDNLKRLDVVYTESDPVYHAVRAHGIRTIKAFGTDTDFYKPNPEVIKDIPYFYPATFSPWKRQDEIADLSSSLYLIGTLQPDGLDIYQRCANKGCIIGVGYFPATMIRKMYQRAKEVVIPAIHGSERTCLEAMATDILPVVTHPEHEKLYSYIKEFKESGLESPREFVLKNYSHRKYAKDLLRGIEESINESNNSSVA